MDTNNDLLKDLTKSSDSDLLTNNDLLKKLVEAGSTSVLKSVDGVLTWVVE